MRAVVQLDTIGERTIWIDCDVIQADGGTRTASITGAFITLHDAFKKLMQEGKIGENPLIDSVAAISVGIVGGEIFLDLNYEEDSTAEVDMNLVMTDHGHIVEIQGPAEGMPFSKEKMDDMIGVAVGGIRELISIQKSVLGDSNLMI
jgi:ribonuclease PH